jgi:hypothetical protein
MSAESAMPLVSFVAVQLEGVTPAPPITLVSHRLSREVGIPEEELVYILASEVGNAEAPPQEFAPGLAVVSSPRLGDYIVHWLEGAIAVMRPEEAELYSSAGGSGYVSRAAKLDLVALRARRRSVSC